ncbi:MAG: cytochrome P450 [Xanthobacteraceae bacterium]
MSGQPPLGDIDGRFQLAMVMTATETLASFRPPAPVPRAQAHGAIGLLKALWENPLEAWTQAHFETPIVSAELLMGRAAVVSDPRAVRRVLVENAANYRKDSLQQRILAGGLGKGLLAVEGEQWRLQRRTLAPMFSRKTVMSFAPAMVQAGDALLQRWRGLGDGCVVDVAAEMTALTIDVLERTIFSDGLGRRPDEVRRAMTSYFDTIGRIDPCDVLGLPDFVPRLTRVRAGATVRFFDAAVDAIIATRRRNLQANPAGVPRDILTLLLEAHDPETGRGISEAELRANILTFIAAGQETTANALTWSLFLLSQSDEWRDRVAAEADREMGGPPDGLAERLVETRAVIDEALRLYPPIVAISRVAIGPDELAGTRIARGTIVVVAPYVLHRHRLLWDRPDLFDPNRFLGAAEAKIDRFAYLPFGVGARICIGAAFALQEATLVLARIIKNFTLELRPGHSVWPLHRVTLKPKGGLPMVLRNRD